jgi:periplasmic protein CpxP/Spy
MKPTRFAVLSVGTAALMIAAIAVAQPPGGGPGFGPGPGGPGGWGHHHRGGPMMIMGLLADELELSDGQREQIHGILDDAHQQAEPLWKAVGDARQALMDASSADPVDEAAVRVAATQLADAEANAALNHAQVLAQVRSILTPEQRTKADEIRQRMLEHRDEFRQRMLDRWGGPEAARSLSSGQPPKRTCRTSMAALRPPGPFPGGRVLRPAHRRPWRRARASLRTRGSSR